jgi:hypothetical protein
VTVVTAIGSAPRVARSSRSRFSVREAARPEERQALFDRLLAEAIERLRLNVEQLERLPQERQLHDADPSR